MTSLPTMPAPHRDWLAAALPVLQADARLVGLAAAGSVATGGMDAWSDLDLLVVVRPDAWDAVLPARAALAARLGPLLAAFTGEHVGEPRLLICLYGPPLLHVDLKFVTPDGLAARVEDPHVVWDRDGSVAAGLAGGRAAHPAPDLQWSEDRVWVWIHYGGTKLGRGELLEACDFLAALRGMALGPLALRASGARPSGVRRVETHAPAWAARLHATMARPDPDDVARALRAAVACYRALRDALDDGTLQRRTAAETAAVAWLEDVAGRQG